MDENSKKPSKVKKAKKGNASGCFTVLLVAAVVITVVTLYNYSLDRKLKNEIEVEGQAIYKDCTANGICPEQPGGWKSSGLGMKNVGGSVKVIGKTRRQAIFYYVNKDRKKFLLCRRTSSALQDSCFAGGVGALPVWQDE